MVLQPVLEEQNNRSAAYAALLNREGLCSGISNTTDRSKIAYMMGSGVMASNRKTLLPTKEIPRLDYAYYKNSCHKRRSAKEAYDALRDSAKMSGNSYELMKSIKSPTILECGSFRLIR